MYIEPEVESSYSLNNLGKTIYDQIRLLKPDLVIDFGVLNGYSTICIAQALRDNGKGRVKAYDLFEKYEFNHSQLEKLVKNLKEYGVLDLVDIEERNFFDWIKNPEPFDAIHIDLSNTGDIVDIIGSYLQNKGLVLFEGGSLDRDRAGWMVRYNKRPINDTKTKFEIINSAFPSISKLI